MLTDEQLLWEIVALLNEAHDDEWNDTADGVYCLLKEYRPEMAKHHVDYCEGYLND